MPSIKYVLSNNPIRIFKYTFSPGFMLNYPLYKNYTIGQPTSAGTTPYIPADVLQHRNVISFHLHKLLQNQTPASLLARQSDATFSSLHKRLNFLHFIPSSQNPSDNSRLGVYQFSFSFVSPFLTTISSFSHILLNTVRRKSINNMQIYI